MKDEKQNLKAALVMQDGTILHGIGFGAKAEAIGELVFNTSMMGYQEALTDPSYGGQILLMTYPLIGNYGINKQDSESGRIHPAGFVVRSASPDYQHNDSEQSLHGFLETNNVPGIQGIDTRFIVRHIRDKGVMPAILAVSDKEIDTKILLEKSRSFDYSAMDFVSYVSVKKPRIHSASARAKKITSPTACSPSCATNSAVTPSRKNRRQESNASSLEAEA